MNSKESLWPNMNKTLLQCPKCLETGKLQILPWATDQDTFGAISLYCDHCDAMHILNFSHAVEVTDENSVKLAAYTEKLLTLAEFAALDVENV